MSHPACEHHHLAAARHVAAAYHPLQAVAQHDKKSQKKPRPTLIQRITKAVLLTGIDDKPPNIPAIAGLLDENGREERGRRPRGSDYHRTLVT